MRVITWTVQAALADVRVMADGMLADGMLARKVPGGYTSTASVDSSHPVSTPRLPV